jgi:hypothetical protein
VEKLNSSIEQQQMILSRLFGSKDIESLASLPREELLNLALSKPDVSSPRTSLPTPNPHERNHSRSEGADSLEALEAVPPHDFEWENPSPAIQSISDDVNGLSMRVDRQSSYVGISSINAALKFIFKTAPMAKQMMLTATTETALPSRAGSPPPYSKDPFALPSTEEGEELLASFFEKVHPYLPMVDEEGITNDYRAGTRKDPPYFALLNMIFALGSLASGTSDNDAHIAYFKRARAHVNPKLETFGNPGLEVLQALAMMGGYYLHYLNRPNEADALMGATLRVACAIGVHREYVEPSLLKNSSSTHTMNNSSNNGTGQPEGEIDGNENTLAPSSKPRSITADIRRRTWWTIFCLDTWATTTTGRPSLGRYSPGVTVLEPGQVSNVRLVTTPNCEALS